MAVVFVTTVALIVSGCWWLFQRRPAYGIGWIPLQPGEAPRSVSVSQWRPQMGSAAFAGTPGAMVEMRVGRVYAFTWEPTEPLDVPPVQLLAWKSFPDGRQEFVAAQWALQPADIGDLVPVGGSNGQTPSVLMMAKQPGSGKIVAVVEGGTIVEEQVVAFPGSVLDNGTARICTPEFALGRSGFRFDLEVPEVVASRADIYLAPSGEVIAPNGAAHLNVYHLADVQGVPSVPDGPTTLSRTGNAVYVLRARNNRYVAVQLGAGIDCVGLGTEEYHFLAFSYQLLP